MKCFEKLMRRFGYVKLLSKQNKIESFDNSIELYDDNVQVNISYKNPQDAIQALKADAMHSVIWEHAMNDKRTTINWLDVKDNTNEEISPYDVVDFIFDKFHQRIVDMGLEDIIN